MNAIPPISQAQSGSDAAQLNPAASAASPPARGADQDFAGALRDAGGKPARKGAGNKQNEAPSSGSALPVPGNQPPLVPASPAAPTPAASPPAVKTELLTAQAADVAGAAGASTGAAAGAVTGLAGGTAGADPGVISATPILTANEGSTSGLAPTLDLAAAPGGDAPRSTANSPAVSVSGLNVPQAPKSLALASAATSSRIPAPPRAGASDAKSNDGLPSQGTTATASSQTSNSAANDPAFTGPAATDANAPAQALMAAAIVQGTGAPPADFTSSSNDLFSNDLAGADTAPQVVAAAKDAPAGAPAAALAQASAALSAALSAAVSAATAGRIAQEVSSAAGTGAADKRSHANSPDLSLSGTSNDGSAGAAQLLTSNTTTESSPATLKVAAAVDTAGFGQGVAEKVSVMMDANLTNAKLQVNPPALGPIEVRIALQGGHAQVWLSSHSAVTRDALESSSPKLREMLGSQGFSQVSVDISQRSFQDRSPPSRAYEATPSIRGDAPALTQASASISRSAIGLLDAYA